MPTYLPVCLSNLVSSLQPRQLHGTQFHLAFPVHINVLQKLLVVRKRKIQPKMRSAALFARQRTHRDQPRDVEEVSQIQVFLPLEVVASQRLQGDTVEPFSQSTQLVDSLPELEAIANQSDFFPHERLHFNFQIDDSFSPVFVAASIKWAQSLSYDLLKLSIGHITQ